MSETYNPGTHITAGELRRRGMSVPEDIPDHAWIRKSAVVPETRQQVVAGELLHYLTAKFTEPWRTDPGDAGPDWDPIQGAIRRPAAPVTLLGPNGKRLTHNHGRW
jgi:hypothetical protein